MGAGVRRLMELDELEILRQQVNIQAEKLAQLMFENSRQQAIITVLNKPEETETGDDR